MKNEKIVNIINILVDKTTGILNLELAYKSKKIDENTEIFLMINEREKINPNNIKKSNSTEESTILINFDIELVKEQCIKIFIEENSKIYNAKITDNKNRKIVEKPNEYKIFTKNYSINIKDIEIEIKRKKNFEKLKYEINKQKYSKKKYGKFCFFRLINGKKKYYLFNDRILFADDNAEQFFKSINQNHKKIAKRCYFVIDKDSKRVEELKKIGKILKFGSFRHKIKYINSRIVISSHSSYYDRVYNPFNEDEMEMYKDIINKKFVFLQHGVIMNDVHNMLNRTKTIADLFITTTNSEYEIVKSPLYLYDEKQVACTGLARFDRLTNEDKNIILIAPTWRTFLTEVEYNSEEEKEESFVNSEFYIKYKNVLSNKELIKKLKEKNMKIKFLLHPVFSEHKKEFTKLENENIEILSIENIRYSELFKECSIFITDYSSTHYDVAFLQKPIIYYQFDKERFFASHYQKGYFSYEQDGFGPVIEDEEELITKIIYYIENNCKPDEEYLDKIRKTFKYLDRNNSERIYNELIKIDKPNEVNYRFNNVH